MLDALIGNTDRHHENWGLVLQGTSDHQDLRLAPTFDHASSLGRNETDERREARLGLTRWLATPRERDQHSTERRQTRGHCRRSTHSGRPPSFDRTPREIGSAGFEPSVTVSSDPS
jgi:hypothetical protein